jgi:flagellin
VTKSTSDLALYNTELTQLKGQLNLMLDEEFNGISLFSEGVAAGGSASANGLDMDTNPTLVVVASHDGNQTIGITQVDLNQIVFDITDTASTSSYMDISTTVKAQDAVEDIQTAIQKLATIRANNGAEQSRLTFAADMLAVNKTNLEAANSRIIDVDVADESTKLARYNILQQAGTAMLAQANQSTQSILRLIS